MKNLHLDKFYLLQLTSAKEFRIASKSYCKFKA